MRKTLELVIAMLVVLAVSAGASAQGTFPLKYQLAGPEDASILDASILTVRPVDKRAAEPRLPRDFVGRPTCFRAAVEGRDVLMVLDGDKPVKLYVDSSGSGDISGERPIEGKQMGARPGSGKTFDAFETVTTFGPVDIGGRSITIENDRGHFVRIRPAGFVAGAVRLGGKDYRVAVVDGDFDGAYSTRITMPYSAASQKKFDWFAIDLNGNGVLEPGAAQGELEEFMPMPKMIRAGGEWYSVAVARDGSTIDMEKTDPEFGALDVGSSDVRIMLFSESGVHLLKAGPGKWQLPAGRYSAAEITLAGKDRRGADWAVSAWSSLGKLQDFEILPGRASVMKAGEPLTVQAEVVNLESGVGIYMRVTGQGGEQYTGQVEKDGKLLPAPKFKISNELGQLFEAGQFAYG